MNKSLLPSFRLCVLSLFIGHSFLLTSCSIISDNSTPPNIILFFVDDMGWQDTSVPFWSERTHLNDKFYTPNMERLAEQGMKFTQAYATPICSPTRISLMTGMNAARHRVTNWTLNQNELKSREIDHESLIFPMWNMNGLTTDGELDYAVHATPFPQVLNDHGYYTIHAGKAHLAAIGTTAEDPLNIGFDVNIAGHAAGAPKSYHGLENFGNIEEFKDSPWPVPGLEKYHGEDIFLTEAITRESLHALEIPVNNDQPFFLYMSLYGIHTPIMADNRFVQKYYDQKMDSVEAHYCSMVESMDNSLGDLMNFVEDHNLSENTIIIFMSDNGGLSAHTRGGEKHMHNYPLASGKGSIYEGGIREPMIVKWPGITKPNSLSSSPLIIEDFYPTILEMAGVDNYNPVQHIDGHSFTNLLKGNSSLQSDKPLFWHFPNQWGADGPGIAAFSAIRSGDWKLIYYHEDESFELFNISQDISEKENLFGSRKEVAIELATTLSDYLKSVNAQMPVHKSTNQAVSWPINAL